MKPSVRRRATDRMGGLASLLFICFLVRAPQPSLRALAPSAWEWPHVGLASWYSEQDPGVTPLTASGETLDDGALTAAMWDLPLDSCVQVTNLRTLKTITVRVNDRGPHPRLWLRGRVIDLSKAAFSSLADPNDGLIPVQLDIREPTRCRVTPVHA